MFSHKRILIKGGKVVNDDTQFEADVYIEGDKIKMVGPQISLLGDVKIIDGRGKLVIPGGINVHTHFLTNANDADNFYNGTKYALAGGVTMIMDYAIDKRCSPLEAYHKWRTAADKKVCCDYGLHIALCFWSEDVLKQMELLTQEGGINSFMVCSLIKNLKGKARFHELNDMFMACHRLGAIANFHLQNLDTAALNKNVYYQTRLFPDQEKVCKAPVEMKVSECLKALMYARQAECPMYISQIQNRESAELIDKMLDEDCSVSAEVVLPNVMPKDVFQSNQSSEKPAGCVTTPHVEYGMENAYSYFTKLLSRGIVQSIGTGICNYNFANESNVISNPEICGNVRDLENTMSNLWNRTVATGCLTPCEFVALTSTNVAKFFNLYPSKGRIQAGSEADVVVWDPDGHRTVTPEYHQGSSAFRIFEGVKIRGKPVSVIYKGRIVVEDGELLSLEPGSGRFVPTLPFPPHVFFPLKTKAASKVLKKYNECNDPRIRKWRGGEGDENIPERNMHYQAIKSKQEHNWEEKPILLSGAKDDLPIRATGAKNATAEMKTEENASRSPPKATEASSQGDSKKAQEAKDKQDAIPLATEKPPLDPLLPAEKTQLRSTDAEQDSPFIGGSFRRYSDSDSEFRSRPPTRSGSRNLLDSTFSLSGAQIDDDRKTRPTIRVKNPPGGRSSGIWYS